MTDIFISYSREDQAKALPIAEALRSFGWSVFMDVRIKPGERWDEIIEDNLKASKCVLVLWSPISIDRRWVRIEANHGVENAKLLPVTIDGARPPISFSLEQTQDLSDWSGHTDHAAFQKVLLGVIRYVGNPRPATLGIKNEKKQNTLHDIDSPPEPFPAKIYDASIPPPIESLEVLELYNSESRKYRNIAETTVERIIPYPKHLVWKVLLETEHLYAWTGHLEPTKALPDRFGRGTPIGDGEILDCEPESSLTFRIKTGFYVYSYAEQAYLRVDLQPTGDNSTKFVLTFYLSTNHTDKLSRLIKNTPFIKGKQKESDAAWRSDVIKENIKPMQKAAKKFAYLCHDRIEHGAAQIESLGDSSLNWHVWEFNSGRLKIAPCDSASCSLTIGDQIDKDAVLGYVHDTGPNIDHEKFKNDYYIKEPRGGFIRDIEKNDGYKVERGDRLYLLSDEPDTPLDVVYLPRKREVDTLISNAAYDYHLSVLVQPGDWVNTGQLIGYLSGRSSNAKVEYRSQLRGQIISISSDSSHNAKVALRTPKLT